MSKYKSGNIFNIRCQQGAATLLITIILLIGVTLITLFAAKVGILDQRISANEYRYKEAFANAEAGLDQAAAFLRENPSLHDEATDGWTSCIGVLYFPCDIDNDGTVNMDFVYVSPEASVEAPSLPVVSGTTTGAYLVKLNTNLTHTIAIGSGASADGTGWAVTQLVYATTRLLTPAQIPPLMSPEINLSGNFTIVSNPNGGGPGIPVSAWVKSLVTTNGVASWQTCNHGEFQNGTSGSICMETLDDTNAWKVCGCTETLSEPADIGDDLVINPDPNDFPDSPFDFLFNGKSQADVKDLAAQNGKVIADCGLLSGPPTIVDGDALSALDLPLIWVTGNCNFPSGSIIGDRTTPIILVVEGDVKANGTLDLWGLVLGLANFTLNGNTVIHGSVISEVSSDLTSGGYSQVYDENVFSALAGDTLTVDIAKIKYSWRDF